MSFHVRDPHGNVLGHYLTARGAELAMFERCANRRDRMEWAVVDGDGVVLRVPGSTPWDFNRLERAEYEPGEANVFAGIFHGWAA